MEWDFTNITVMKEILFEERILANSKYMRELVSDLETKMMVFAGNANRFLAEAIAGYLNIPLGKAIVGRFSDGEVAVEIIDSVRGKDVFIIQSTCRPANEHLMELLIMMDAVHRASAKRVTAVIPYFGYARQDRRPRSARVSIAAKVVANMLSNGGANRVLTMDLHADQIQGFFDIPVDNVYSSPILLGDIWRHRHANPIVVSPDVGGVVRARAIAKRLDDADLAIIDKRRPRANESQVMNIIGDVEGRSCILVDDMVDTAGTLCKAAAALKEHGATQVVAYCTHPVLSGPAVDNIDASVLDELVVTDTIPLDRRAATCSRIRQLSIAELLAESIRRISVEESMSPLFMD
jgi:ribose-phosphate pyrophosphokinase